MFGYLVLLFPFENRGHGWVLGSYDHFHGHPALKRGGDPLDFYDVSLFYEVWNSHGNLRYPPPKLPPPINKAWFPLIRPY